VIEMFRALQHRIDRIENRCPSGPLPLEDDAAETITRERRWFILARLRRMALADLGFGHSPSSRKDRHARL
jgi:hypothetical protein